jgi:hypothetical protein
VEKPVDVQSLAIGTVIAGGIMAMMYAVRAALADSTLVKRRMDPAHVPGEASAPRSMQRPRSGIERPRRDAGRDRF